jgi:hypothetical protein
MSSRDEGLGSGFHGSPPNPGNSAGGVLGADFASVGRGFFERARFFLDFFATFVPFDVLTLRSWDTAEKQELSERVSDDATGTTTIAKVPG